MTVRRSYAAATDQNVLGCLGDMDIISLCPAGSIQDHMRQPSMVAYILGCLGAMDISVCPAGSIQDHIKVVG